MYSVVGCSECESVKIVEGKPETTVCNRCGKTLQFNRLKVFFESDNLEAAKEARSLLLAKRNDLDVFYQGMMENLVERGEFQDEVMRRFGEDELLEQEGVDKEEVEEASEKVEEHKGSDPKKRIVMDAIEFLDEPRDEDIIEFAQERGVDPEFTEEAVDKLCMEGKAMRTREGVVRLL